MVTGGHRNRAAFICGDHMGTGIAVVGDIGTKALQQRVRDSGIEANTGLSQGIEKLLRGDHVYLPPGISSRISLIGMHMSEASSDRWCVSMDSAVFTIAG